MKINVTEEHIKKGKMRECTMCPVAWAIRDFYKMSHISVHSCLIEIDGDTFFTPHSVANFISRFDMGGFVEPFSFEIGEPVES